MEAGLLASFFSPKGPPTSELTIIIGRSYSWIDYSALMSGGRVLFTQKSMSRCLSFLLLVDRLNRSYDVEYPVEVDDEYWTNPDPELAFKQPTGKLSSITAFNLLLKLGEILGTVLRVLVRTSHSVMP